jgi:hypothetical protein
MPVLQVGRTTALEADHVYALSPGLQWAMNDGCDVRATTKSSPTT